MKRLFTTLLVLVLSLALALGLAEGVLRVFPGLMSEKARLRVHWAGLGASEATVVEHPTIGFLPRPGLTQTIERTDLSFTSSVDAQGFRNSTQLPPEVDVVAVGDSLTFGYGVDDGLGWSDLVMQDAPGLSLYNLGLVGGAPQQYLRVYEAFGRARSPRVLLFGLFLGNDITDARKFASWVESGDGGNSAFWGGRRRTGWLAGTLAQLRKRSHLDTLIKEARRSYPLESHSVELSGGGRMQFVPGFLKSVNDPEHPDFLRIAEAVERAAELAQEDGTHFVLVFFPTKEEVYLPILELRAPNPTGPFLQYFKKRGLTILDLRPALQERARLGEQLYFEVDGHPNAAGYRVVADAVLAHLRANAAAYGLEL